MPAGLRARGEDLRAQHGRMQGGAALAHRRIEERRDQVARRAGDLRLHHSPGDLEVGLVAAQDLRRVPAAVDDLHVVDRDDRQPVVHGEEVAPALEVRDHHLGLELLRQVEVRADVARPAARHRAADVLQERPEAPHLVVLGDDGESPDLAHAQVLARPLREVVVRAARDHHLDVVPLHQLVEHDARADGVAHALADHPIEDPHGLFVTHCPLINDSHPTTRSSIRRLRRLYEGGSSLSSFITSRLGSGA